MHFPSSGFFNARCDWFCFIFHRSTFHHAISCHVFKETDLLVYNFFLPSNDHSMLLHKDLTDCLLASMMIGNDKVHSHHIAHSEKPFPSRFLFVNGLIM